MKSVSPNPTPRLWKNSQKILNFTKDGFPNPRLEQARNKEKSLQCNAGNNLGLDSQYCVIGCQFFGGNLQRENTPPAGFFL